MTTRIVAPTRLGAKAKRVWNEISSEYELRADELRVLEDACREIDIVERLELEFRTAKTMVLGSQGQLVASPLLQELRQHRTTLARLLGQLKLPDGEEGAGSAAKSRSEAGRAMANARWSRGA